MSDAPTCWFNFCDPLQKISFLSAELNTIGNSVKRPITLGRASAGRGTGTRYPAEHFSGTPLIMSGMSLHDPAGNRLYLNAEERAAFLAAARCQPACDHTLCETLHFTGCHPSEPSEITPARVDLSGGTIAIWSLGKV